MIAKELPIGKDECILEFGSFYGAATSALAEGLQNRNEIQAIQIFTFDKFICQDWSQRQNMYYNLKTGDNFQHIFKQNTQRFNNIIESFQHEFGNQEKDKQIIQQVLKNKKISILVYDGDPNYNFIKNYMDNLVNYLLDGAIIIFNEVSNINAQGLRNYIMDNTSSLEFYVKIFQGAKAYKYKSNAQVVEKFDRNMPIFQFLNLDQTQLLPQQLCGKNNQTNKNVYIKKFKFINDRISSYLPFFEAHQDLETKQTFLIEQILNKTYNLEDRIFDQNQLLQLGEVLSKIHNRQFNKNEFQQFSYLNWLNLIQQQGCQYSNLNKFYELTINVLENFKNIFQNEVLQFCHGKLSTYKIIFDKKDNNIQIIDWEHCLIGNPAIDFIYLKENLSNQDYKLIKQNYQNQIDDTIFEQQILFMMILFKLFDLMNHQCDKDMQRRKCTSIINYIQQLTEQNEFYSEIFVEYESLVYELIQRIESKFEKKINIQNKIPTWPDNIGWTYVENLLIQHFHNQLSKTIFITAIEAHFRKNQDLKLQQIICDSQWGGIMHQIPFSNCYTDLQRFLHNNKELLTSSQALFTLTERNKTFLKNKKELNNVDVNKVIYCMHPPKFQFNIKNFMQPNKIRNLLFIGEFEREINSFINLKTNNKIYSKQILGGNKIKKADQQPNQDIIYHEYLPNQVYERLVSESIVFLKLYDAGGCTTVIECISTNTPILVNRLEALEEYLGKNYPFFYQSFEEAECLLNNEEEIIKTYHYLCKMDKTFLYPEQFLQNIANTAFYKLIKPCIKEQKSEKTLNKYDITVFLISYKRIHNLVKILDALSCYQQNSDLTVELILWNNNSEESSYLDYIKYKYINCFNNLILINSHQNMYCIVRSAAAQLANGKLLLFVDDDVLPSQLFLKNLSNIYWEKSNNFKDKIVLCLRGNQFCEHTLNTQNVTQQWGQYDKIRFLNQFQNEDEVDVIHADVMLLETELMKQVSSYELPFQDFKLVDDYWYSYVIKAILKIQILKIQSDVLMQILPDADDPETCLHQQKKVKLAKSLMYAYHMKKGWPFWQNNQISHNEISDDKKQMTDQILQARLVTVYDDQQKINFWKQRFSGTNISAFQNNHDLNDALNDGINVFRIGAVQGGIETTHLFDKPANLLYKQDFFEIERITYELLKNGQKTIITLNNLPYRNQELKDEDKFWEDTLLQDHVIDVWIKLVQLLKKYENVIGYDLINEPNPQKKQFPVLIKFYKKIISKIRSIDSKTPIILEIPQKNKFNQFQEFFEIWGKDQSIMFSFHFYEPYIWTSSQKYKSFSYPGKIPISYNINNNWVGDLQDWDNETIISRLKIIQDLQHNYNIQSDRILVGELGVKRDANGAEIYLKDLIQNIQSAGWNWLFYAYREKYWNKMNYELGLDTKNSKKVQNPLYSIIKQHLIKQNEKLDIQDLTYCFMQKNDRYSWLEYNPEIFTLRNNEDKVAHRSIQYYLQYEYNFDLNMLFIIGCGRSGTTLLTNVLSNYNEILALNEPRELWYTAFPQFNIWADIKGSVLDLNDISEIEISHIRDLFYLILNQIPDKNIIVEKTPENIFRIKALLQIFPNSKFIYIDRIQQNVVSSICKIPDWYGKNSSKWELLKKYSIKNNVMNSNGGKDEETEEFKANIEYQASKYAIQEFLPNKNQFLKIDYENLISNPIEILKEIEQFTQLKSSQKVIKFCKDFIV